jgi:uncharacterized membrane protein
VYFAITGAVIIVLSSLFSVFFVKRNHSQQPKEVKVVLFGLYFWGLVFLQSIVWALAYSFLEKFAQ